MGELIEILLGIMTAVGGFAVSTMVSATRKVTTQASVKRGVPGRLVFAHENPSRSRISDICCGSHDEHHGPDRRSAGYVSTNESCARERRYRRSVCLSVAGQRKQHRFSTTLGSFVGSRTKLVFKPGVDYQFRIDANFDCSTDPIFGARFKKPRADGKQEVVVSVTKGLDATVEIASGFTNANLPVTGGGMFLAGICDAPFFFDLSAFNSAFIQGKPGFPRPPATSTNLYGPSANVLGLVLEVPSSTLAGSNTVLGVWARTVQRGAALDRCGKPFINLMLIPPVPRSDTSLGDQRKGFNRGVTFNDVADFGDAVNRF